MQDKLLKVTLLGTGTSGGVPSLGCHCPVCRSINPKDKRLRSVCLLETATTRILIDCGPDIRQQMMHIPFQRLDGILLTHVHYDHVGGLDDLRPFCTFGDINIYADYHTTSTLRQTMPYCFEKNLYPGVPHISLHNIKAHKQIQIGDIPILPITVMHDNLPILGFRFGKFAYITDMKSINDAELEYLTDLDVLVVNALRFQKEHHSHMLVKDAIAFAKKIGANHTYLTHCSHGIGLYEESPKQLPQNVELAYDGLAFNVSSSF